MTVPEYFPFIYQTLQVVLMQISTPLNFHHHPTIWMGTKSLDPVTSGQYRERKSDEQFIIQTVYVEKKLPAYTKFSWRIPRPANP